MVLLHSTIQESINKEFDFDYPNLNLDIDPNDIEDIQNKMDDINIEENHNEQGDLNEFKS